jgi:hypothetical protein
MVNGEWAIGKRQQAMSNGQCNASWGLLLNSEQKDDPQEADATDDDPSTSSGQHGAGNINIVL